MESPNGYSPQQGGGGAHAAVTTYEQPALFERIMAFMSAELQRHRGAKRASFLRSSMQSPVPPRCLPPPYFFPEVAC